MTHRAKKHQRVKWLDHLDNMSMISKMLSKHAAIWAYSSRLFLSIRAVDIPTMEQVNARGAPIILTGK